LENFILASSLINNSVIKLLANDKNLTKDLGGRASTKETTKKLISILNHYI
jgi:isocitrate/isopropylmalate dehydrogenase